MRANQTYDDTTATAVARNDKPPTLCVQWQRGHCDLHAYATEKTEKYTATWRINVSRWWECPQEDDTTDTD